ncbi:uncharacterized protein B0I36DRAFT_314792 [Microdochium trichocladiopsis]|uniref:Uncharacterized protein n=1 Tax=Microdochium trichocladiopsis TaxID=1682393 RepID=A0A9P8YGZ7_9PEZI|nr:uncharacterized protein B0I36DRAFT_314792 [Microdochium trichocladiopsis]KAH7037778.1 hypothetical protein B0I36DRAFT_314792 [Microdochium trichocladiopsis]
MAKNARSSSNQASNSKVHGQAEEPQFRSLHGARETDKYINAGTWPVSSSVPGSFEGEQRVRTRTEVYPNHTRALKRGRDEVGDGSAGKAQPSLEKQRAEASRAMQDRSGARRFEKAKSPGTPNTYERPVADIEADVCGRFERLRASLAEIEGEKPGELPLFTSTHVSDVEAQRPTPHAVGEHTCEWREKYSILATEIRSLRAELSSRTALRQSVAAASADQTVRLENGDLGIEGVTIVMHIRSKDDLVINTDLS